MEPHRGQQEHEENEGQQAQEQIEPQQTRVKTSTVPLSPYIRLSINRSLSIIIPEARLQGWLIFGYLLPINIHEDKPGFNDITQL